jgi:hypothetical protein
MFDELLGLPAHPLLVHAAVVFVPLLVAVSVVYALVPRVRRWITWAVLGLAVAAPFAAWFATLSGNAFRNEKVSQGAPPEMLAEIDQHRDFGDQTLWASIALAAFAVGLVAVQRFVSADRGAAKLILTIVLGLGVVGLGVASGYYVYKAGDSGARMVWGS